MVWFFILLYFISDKWSVVATEFVLLLVFALCLIVCLLVQKKKNVVLFFLQHKIVLVINNFIYDAIEKLEV